MHIKVPVGTADVCVTVRRGDLLALLSLALEAADEIEAQVNERYCMRDEYSVQERRHRRDMRQVEELRKAVAASGLPWPLRIAQPH